MGRITKPTSIITSIGRTGTKFFAELIREVVPNATSFHEPDVFHLAQWRGHTVSELISQIRAVGIENLILRKAIGKWSLIDISDRRVSGQFNEARAGQLLNQQRKRFINKQSGKLYFESNAGYYGLIDIICDVFENQKVAYIIRDGRDWVISMINWGEMYHKNMVRKSLGHTWLTAKDFIEDPYHDRWDMMSRFERLCWAWNKLNKFALESINSNPNAKLFIFERIFVHKNRYEYLDEMMTFLLDHPGIEIARTQSIHGWLDKKIHKSSGKFPDWQGWSAEQKRQFNTLCGSLMEELGYY